MKSRYRNRISLLVLGGALVVAAVATAAFAASGGHSRTAADHKCPIATGSGDAAFVKNFNPFNNGTSRDFTWGGIYENLLVTTAFGGGNSYNMLAKSLTYSKDGKTLNITIVPNAKWSNGKPVTAVDVAYSLSIGKQDKAADRIGLTDASSNIKSISVTGARSVAVKFNAVDSTFVGSKLPNAPIVPKAIWSKVTNIMDFTNPNPVGSGPFNRITRFNGQDYVLGKNPNYYKAGLPKIPCIERIAAASNDAALLQIVNGEADWTHNFVPNVESAYQAKDPAHYHNAYLTTGVAGRAVLRPDEVPVQPRRFPQGRQPGDQSAGCFQARRIRLCAGDVRARSRADVSEVDRSVPQGEGQGDGGVLACRGQGCVPGSRLHLQGVETDRPEG